MKLAFQVIGFPFRLAAILFAACCSVIPLLVILSIEPEWAEDFEWDGIWSFLVKGVTRNE